MSLRQHQDSCRVLLKHTEENFNFHALLCYRANDSDNLIKNHQWGNAMYHNPLIQNELINTFGELIQKHLGKCFKNWNLLHFSQ